MSHLTDPHTITDRMKKYLQEHDPAYENEAHALRFGISMLKEALTPEQASIVDTLICAQDQRMAANLIYLIWNGIHQNLSCFHNPVNKLFLETDFEDFHQEHLMYSLPAAKTAQQLIDEAYRAIPSELRHLAEPITSYYCYLDTSAYKLAHYLGFRLADELLYWVVPGYIHDAKTTCAYRTQLTDYLNIDISD